MINWSKLDWKLLRDVMWSALAAYALVVFFRLLSPPEGLAAFMGWVSFIAATVVIFNLVFRRKT